MPFCKLRLPVGATAELPFDEIWSANSTNESFKSGPVETGGCIELVVEPKETVPGFGNFTSSDAALGAVNAGGMRIELLLCLFGDDGVRGWIEFDSSGLVTLTPFFPLPMTGPATDPCLPPPLLEAAAISMGSLNVV